MTFMAILEQSTVQRETIITFQIKNKLLVWGEQKEKDGEIVENVEICFTEEHLGFFVSSFEAEIWED